MLIQARTSGHPYVRQFWIEALYRTHTHKRTRAHTAAQTAQTARTAIKAKILFTSQRSENLFFNFGIHKSAHLLALRVMQYTTLPQFHSKWRWKWCSSSLYIYSSQFHSCSMQNIHRRNCNWMCFPFRQFHQISQFSASNLNDNTNCMK